MGLRTTLVKPFAAAYRARAYLIVAAVFGLLHAAFPAPFARVSGEGRLWWHDLIDKGVGSFDKIAYLAALAGLLYAVLSDAFDYIWTNSLQAEVHRGFAETGKIMKESMVDAASGLASLSFEAVKIWVVNSSEPAQARTIARTALVEHYGRHNEASDDIITFLMEEILDKSAAESAWTWENFDSNVTIRPSQIKGHFEWEERRTYKLVCKAKSGTLPLRLEGSAQVAAQEVMGALDSMRFLVTCDGKRIVDLHEWWTGNRNKASLPRFKIEGDGITIEYDGVWLRFEVARSHAIDRERTDVMIYEKSHISCEDRCYSLAVRHPTKGLQASLSLEGVADWAVKPPVTSAAMYQRENQTVQINSFSPDRCHTNVPGWTLPGLAVVIEWSPIPKH